MAEGLKLWDQSDSMSFTNLGEASCALPGDEL